MTEEEALKAEATKLVESFKELKVVQEYLSLKEAIANDEELNQTKIKAKEKRKQIALSDNIQDQLKLIAEVKELEKSINDDPKLINLSNDKEIIDEIAKKVILCYFDLFHCPFFELGHLKHLNHKTQQN